MPIITLTTDFGYADVYAAQFRGDLLRMIPEAMVIDLTHQIPDYNIVTGAYAVKHSYLHFPPDTVHVVRVNEQGIGNEDIIAAYYNRHYFIAPDNGILPLVFNGAPEWIRKADVDKFSGRRAGLIYARLCKMLLEGFPDEAFLKPADDIKQQIGFAVMRQETAVRGIVVMVDHFGNLITNIHITDLNDYLRRFDEMEVQYRDREVIRELSNYYNDVRQGEPLARFNDDGYLEIAINTGNAAGMLGIRYGDIVNVRFR